MRLVAGNAVNTQVLIEELDGSGDVYAAVYLKEYRPLEAYVSHNIAEYMGVWIEINVFNFF